MVIKDGFIEIPEWDGKQLGKEIMRLWKELKHARAALEFLAEKYLCDTNSSLEHTAFLIESMYAATHQDPVVEYRHSKMLKELGKR
jgi:hypothetical protein